MLVDPTPQPEPQNRIYQRVGSEESSADPTGAEQLLDRNVKYHNRNADAPAGAADEDRRLLLEANEELRAAREQLAVDADAAASAAGETLSHTHSLTHSLSLTLSLWVSAQSVGCRA